MSFDIARYDSERLQRVYHSYGDGDASSAASSSSSSPGVSSGGAGSRPSSARRASRQAVTAGVSAGPAAAPTAFGSRPGSAAARRTQELLLSVTAAKQGPAGDSFQQPAHSRPRSLLDGAAGGSGGGWQAGGRNSAAQGWSGGRPASPEQSVPKARGLVRGSTDAMKLGGRPPSRG